MVIGHSELPTCGTDTESIGIWFSSALSTLLPMHQHVGTEINLLMSGSVSYRYGDQADELRAVAGQCLVIPGGIEHELMAASDDVTMWVIELGSRAKLSLESGPSVVSPPADWRLQVVATARKLWLRPGPRATIELEMQLVQALEQLGHTQAPPQLNLHHSVLRAMKVCEQLGPGELDVNELADESKLSASRLAHLFAEQIGISPIQYRNFARVQRFIQSYSGDERDLLGAAFRAGFGSYTQFHRIFRQVCATSPAAHFEWMKNRPTIDPSRTLGAAAEAALPREATGNQH